MGSGPSKDNNSIPDTPKFTGGERERKGGGGKGGDRGREVRKKTDKQTERPTEREKALTQRGREDGLEKPPGDDWPPARETALMNSQELSHSHCHHQCPATNRAHYISTSTDMRHAHSSDCHTCSSQCNRKYMPEKCMHHD